MEQTKLLHGCLECKLIQNSLWKNTMTLSDKVDATLLSNKVDPAIILLRIYIPYSDTCIHAPGYIHVPLHTFIPAFTCYGKNLETTQMSINNTKDKQIVVHMCNGISHTTVKIKELHLHKTIGMNPNNIILNQKAGYGKCL